jgi:hypothetical protein
MSNSSEKAPVLGGQIPFPSPFPPYASAGQPYQGKDGKWYYPDGRPYSGHHPIMNSGRVYLGKDGKWYNPDGRPYTASQRTMNAGQPYMAVDGKWYYPDGQPYTAVQRLYTAAKPVSNTLPANGGQPSLAEDGKWYYPDGRPYVTTPANNRVRTRLPAAKSTVHEKLAHGLSRLVEEDTDRTESGLRAALFNEADEAALLGIYKKSYTEDTPQFRLARKNLKSLDADKLRQGLSIDRIVDAGARIYPAKLELSTKFGTFKKAVLGGRSLDEFDQAAKDLLETYEPIGLFPEFTKLGVPDPGQVRAEVSRLRSLFEVRLRLAETREAVGGSMIKMDQRFWIVLYPGLPKDTVHAIDPQVCLWGTGTGAIEIRDAGLPDLGVPLLIRAVPPLPEIPRPPAPSGAFIQNSKASPATVHYLADGASYELKPGQSRTHKVTENSRISYDRGGTLGSIEYRLSPGSFRFAIEDRAWQFTTATSMIVIDNSANGSDFHCDIGGRPKVIPARKALEVASDYPISIRFDREEGQPSSCKLIEETTPVTVTVGVAPGSAAIDLFPGSSEQLCLSPVAPNASAALPQPEPAIPTRADRQRILPTVEDPP